jgi:beta-glucosidase
MKSLQLIIALLLLLNFSFPPQSTKKDIYHSGWIDLNKNGRMDVYEDPKADIEQRVTDLLSQMTLEEKTCQTATLYGYNRVLKDELPTPEWKKPDLERRNRQHRRTSERLGSRI